MSSVDKPLTCPVCEASVPRGAEACPNCGARQGGGKEYVLFDPLADTADEAWEPLAEAAALPQETKMESDAADGWLDLSSDVVALARLSASKSQAAAPKRRWLREDGPAWSPLTWAARLMGWAVERQIRAGRRYVFHPTMGVGVIEVDKAGKRHGAAAYEPQMNAFSVAFVGLVPGAGNLWMRQWIRGTALAVPGLILLLIVLATWTESSSNFWVGVLAALMAFSYDCAAKNRRRLRGDDYDFSTRLQMLGLLALAIAGLAVLLRLVPFYWTLQIDSRKCEPFLRNGDIVLFNKWPAFVGGVKKGDVICYAAKRFGFLDAQGLSGNVQEESRIGRVLAVAGDTVEIRDRKIRVNNQELPDSAPIYSSIKPIAMPSRALNSGEWWVLYGNIQSDHAIAAYAGDWTAPADWNGLPEGARLHAQSWSDACVVEKRQIIGVATAVLFPPERRRWLR